MVGRVGLERAFLDLHPGKKAVYWGKIKTKIERLPTNLAGSGSLSQVASKGRCMLNASGFYSMGADVVNLITSYPIQYLTFGGDETPSFTGCVLSPLFYCHSGAVGQPTRADGPKRGQRYHASK